MIIIIIIVIILLNMQKVISEKLELLRLTQKFEKLNEKVMVLRSTKIAWNRLDK